MRTIVKYSRKQIEYKKEVVCKAQPLLSPAETFDLNSFQQGVLATEKSGKERMNMKKLLFIYNPNAGTGMLKPKLADVLDIFTKAGYESTVYPTQR